MKNTYDDVSNFKREWKLSSEDDDVPLSDKSTSSNEDEISMSKTKNLDPPFKFKYKRIMVLVNGSINFKKCYIFNNIHHFKYMSREYEVKLWLSY